MKLEILEKMRDCVKDAFLDGCQRGQEFQKMRHAIIAELKRLGCDDSEMKDELIEWNKRCEKPLGVSEQRTQLFKYVDWFIKKNSTTGCIALEDYCIGKDVCIYYQQEAHKKRQEVKELPFDINELEKYLSIGYESKSYILILIVKTLRQIQITKNTGTIIFIGLRKIATNIRDAHRHRLCPMDVSRDINILINEGVIKKVIKGKAGNFSCKANGYVFLPWHPP